MKKPNIFKRIFTFLQDWYDRYFLKFEKEGGAGVVVTNWVKEQFDNGNLEALAKFTPGEFDDHLVAKGKANLVPIFETYAKAHNLAVEGKSRLEVVQVVYNYVKSLGTRRSFWVEISGDLIVFLADGKIDWNEALILGQKVFWQLFNKNRRLGFTA